MTKQAKDLERGDIILHNTGPITVTDVSPYPFSGCVRVYGFNLRNETPRVMFSRVLGDATFKVSA